MSCPSKPGCAPKVVAITGAAGQIGYVLSFRIAAGDLLKDQKIILKLIEIPQALGALGGVCMELTDCAFPNLAGVVATASLEEGFKDADYVFLVGSMPRKDGMDRADLLEKNGGIFQVQGEALAKYAKPCVKVLVVGNPANTNCLVAIHYAVKGGLKPENFSAMTRLDHNRSIGELAEKLNVGPSKIHRTIIWGNHSNTQVVDAEFAEVETCTGVEKVCCKLPKEYLEGEFVTKIAGRGGAVIKARGASSAASAANAAICQMRNWVWGTPYGEWVSMAIYVPDSRPYGITPGLVFSFPVTVTPCGKVNIVEGLELSEFVKGKLCVTEKELLEEKATAWEKLKIE